MKKLLTLIAFIELNCGLYSQDLNDSQLFIKGEFLVLSVHERVFPYSMVN